MNENTLQEIIIQHIKNDPAIVALHKGKDPSAEGNRLTWYLLIAKEKFDNYSVQLKTHPANIQLIVKEQTGVLPDIATHIACEDQTYHSFVGDPVWTRT